jgi:formylmethanofuran dehydrogenase subunit B
MQHNIQFVITRIDGRATDSVKNYHMKFKSDEDYELFKQLLALGFGLEV